MTNEDYKSKLLLFIASTRPVLYQLLQVNENTMHSTILIMNVIIKLQNHFENHQVKNLIF